ncbi:unnamed protein product [Microthlaspi erraticum]|uniref:Reverse transcriptase domain-containing protein n=1 Tax=Microthlaspi erraticum TaxID=1685480 RepID=A0A6D2KXI5_9BRAS|nr:unnamed protein product [Microthlaspi erraticum]
MVEVDEGPPFQEVVYRRSARRRRRQNLLSLSLSGSPPQVDPNIPQQSLSLGPDCSLKQNPVKALVFGSLDQAPSGSGLGLNGDTKQLAVKRWITFNRPLFGGLLETRVKYSNLAPLITRNFPGWRFDSNHSEEAENGRIVVLSSQEAYSFRPSNSPLQGIADFRDCLSDANLFELSTRGVYHTWSNKCSSNPKTRKLDRALINEPWHDYFPSSNAFFDVPGCSDHSPCLVTISDSIRRRVSRFNFFSFFTLHPEYPRLISEAWNSLIQPSDSMFGLYQKLRAAKLCCKSLNSTRFSNIQDRAKQAFENLEMVQRQVLQNPSPGLFEEERVARDDWLLLASAEESFFRQKSRIRWLQEGDENTGFFHKSVKSNLSRNIIHYLQDGLGNRVSDPLVLKGMVLSFYKQLLGTANPEVSPYSIAELRSILSFRCSDSLAEKLIKLPSTEEIKDAVFALPKNKAPAGPTTRGCLQIDITKAYDNVNWDFVLNILEALQLPQLFISWIRSCITSPHYPVALNGELVGFFPGKKGLRQGDPISSSLFVLAMDVLSKALDSGAAQGRFRVHPLCSVPLVTHLSFADDLLVFFDGKEESLEGILEILKDFQKVSGLAKFEED